MKQFLKTFPLIFLGSLAAVASPRLGIDRVEEYRGRLGGLRIALVANQASLNSAGQHTIDFLLAKKFRIVKLFALEHGVRGGGDAGEELPDSRDEVTGLPIVSLYGKYRKPTPEMLRDVDAVVYDIQDVGVRFYTYISSLGLIMEAAAENQKQVFVLDRPNPNGHYVGGPVLKPGNVSFVGAFPIPVVYGLTAGELARMIHGMGWKKTAGLRLTVVPLKDYRRTDLFEPPVWPSPGLQNLKAIRMYPAMALLEPTVMNFGGGTDHSYLQYGYPDPKAGPYSYTPVARRPKQKPRHEGLVCYGEKFYDLPLAEIPRFTTDIFVNVMKRLTLEKFVTEPRFLELLVGDKDVVRRMLAGENYAAIARGLEPELAKFRADRKKYLLYGER